MWRRFSKLNQSNVHGIALIFYRSRHFAERWWMFFNRIISFTRIHATLATRLVRQTNIKAMACSLYLLHFSLECFGVVDCFGCQSCVFSHFSSFKFHTVNGYGISSIQQWFRWKQTTVIGCTAIQRWQCARISPMRTQPSMSFRGECGQQQNLIYFVVATERQTNKREKVWRNAPHDVFVHSLWNISADDDAFAVHKAFAETVATTTWSNLNNFARFANDSEHFKDVDMRRLAFLVRKKIPKFSISSTENCILIDVCVH